MVQKPTVIDLPPEVIEHLMNPHNYGEIKNPDCVGVGYDEKTNEYVIMYAKISNELIEDIKFAFVGCSDTLVAGSMFTDFIKNKTITDAQKASKITKSKIANMPEEKRACNLMVVISFEALLENYSNRKNGKDEELHKIAMDVSCIGMDNV